MKNTESTKIKIQIKEPKTFGEALKRKRIEIGLTQNEIASMLGISRSQYWKYENNYVTPKIFNLEKISKRLGVEKDILLTLRVKAKTRYY